MEEYKKGCGFREKIHVCKFKPENCNPNKCDLYDVDWNLHSVKAELKIVKAKLKQKSDEVFKLKKVKKMVALEKKNPDDKVFVEYKRQLATVTDLGCGVDYLQSALRYLKRTKK